MDAKSCRHFVNLFLFFIQVHLYSIVECVSRYLCDCLLIIYLIKFIYNRDILYWMRQLSLITPINVDINSLIYHA